MSTQSEDRAMNDLICPVQWGENWLFLEGKILDIAPQFSMLATFVIVCLPHTNLFCVCNLETGLKIFTHENYEQAVLGAKKRLASKSYAEVNAAIAAAPKDHKQILVELTS